MNIGRDGRGTAADEASTKNDSNNHFPVTQACAACKFQRRRCSAECPLAPYFPANRLQDFQNVRRLFGVKNVLKTLGDLDLSKRLAAAECMIFEANCRANDPSGGCYRVIASLQREIMLLEAQRQRVLLSLRIYRPTAAAAGSISGTPVSSEICGKPNLSSLLFDFRESENNFEDRMLNEICCLDGVERLIKKENVVDFDLQVNH